MGYFMGLKTKNRLGRFLMLTIFCFTSPCLGKTLSGNETWQESHPEIHWGMSLADFRELKKSKVTFSIDPMEARSLDYLLMDFHEVDKDDPARQPFISVQTVQGDMTTYIFYCKKLYMTVSAVPLEKIAHVEDVVKADDKFLKSDTHQTKYDFSDGYGAFRTYYFYDLYAESHSTLVCLVDVNGLYEDPSYYGNKSYGIMELIGGNLKAAYLVYLSENDMSDENAYRDWLKNSKNASALGVQKTWLEKLKSSIEN
jgi:hypothetical protein